MSRRRVYAVVDDWSVEFFRRKRDLVGGKPFHGIGNAAVGMGVVDLLRELGFTVFLLDESGEFDHENNEFVEYLPLPEKSEESS